MYKTFPHSNPVFIKLQTGSIVRAAGVHRIEMQIGIAFEQRFAVELEPEIRLHAEGLARVVGSVYGGLCFDDLPQIAVFFAQGAQHWYLHKLFGGDLQPRWGNGIELRVHLPKFDKLQFVEVCAI